MIQANQQQQSTSSHLRQENEQQQEQKQDCQWQSQSSSSLRQEDLKYQEKIDRELGNYYYYPNRSFYRQFEFLEYPLPMKKKNSSSSSSSSSCSSQYLHYPQLRYEEFGVERFHADESYVLPYFSTNLTYDPSHLLPPLPSPPSSIHPYPQRRSLRIVLISDTHDRHSLISNIPECDILIHAGDILMKSRKASKEYAYQKYHEFNDWLSKQPAKYRLFIGGNHDKYLETMTDSEIQEIFSDSKNIFMKNKFLNIEGINIYGSPISYGDSNNRAFQSESFLESSFQILQNLVENGKQIDLMISHGPVERLLEIVNPQMFYIHGHTHEKPKVFYLPRYDDHPSSNNPYSSSFSSEFVFNEEDSDLISSLQFSSLSEGDNERKNSSSTNSKVVDSLSERRTHFLKLNATIMGHGYQLEHSPIVLDCIFNRI